MNAKRAPRPAPVPEPAGRRARAAGSGATGSGSRDAPRPGDESFPVQRYLPYGGLLIALALAEALGGHDRAHLWGQPVLSAGAALWMWRMEVPYPAPARRRGRAIAYHAGLTAFIVALALLSPFYGFFAFTGYLHAGVLPTWLRPPAVAVTAATMALCQIGGAGNLHGRVIGAYAALLVVNMVLAGVVVHQVIADDQRSLRRMRTIDELAEANRRLHETMEENAGLQAQLITQAREAGILDERQRMAGEIHDTIAQGLTGIVTQLEAADRFDDDPERRGRHLGTARRLARESLAEARRSVQAMRPGPLDTAAHLPGAIGGLAEQWTETSGIEVRVEVSGEAVPLPPALEVVLFRTAQEGLANIAKHSGARRAGLTLTYTHEVVVLDVLDDGAGFDADARERAEQRADGHGFGLTAMRRRLRQVGGSLTIESAPGDGTVLSAGVPALAPLPGPATAPAMPPGIERPPLPSSVPHPPPAPLPSTAPAPRRGEAGRSGPVDTRAGGGTAGVVDNGL